MLSIMANFCTKTMLRIFQHVLLEDVRLRSGFQSQAERPNVSIRHVAIPYREVPLWFRTIVMNGDWERRPLFWIKIRTRVPYLSNQGEEDAHILFKFAYYTEEASETFVMLHSCQPILYVLRLQCPKLIYLSPSAFLQRYAKQTD